MPFLDVPSAAPTPSSFLLDDTKLAAGRPQAPQELAEASITMPGGSRVDAGPTAGLRSEVLTPLPGFVLKSSLDEPASIFVPSESSSPTFPKGTKLFVNVAHHALVPEPPAAPAGAAPTLLEDLWIPAVVGEMAVTVDKAGKTSLVVDAVFHSSVADRARRDGQYKLFLIQVVLEKVEEKFDADLSRDYATPKTLASKGPLLPRTVVLPSKPAKPLITPSTTPPAPPPAPTSQPSTTTARAFPPASPSPPAGTPPLPPPQAAKPAPALKHTLSYPTPTTFVLVLHLPSTVVPPAENSPALPPTTLQLFPPRTLALAHALLGTGGPVEIDVGGPRATVDRAGLGAEWVVEEGVIRVTGRVVL